MSINNLKGLYVITDDQLSGSHLLMHVQQALTGGACLVQYRSKSGSEAAREYTARAVLELCREHRVPLLINDDAMLAAKIGADGVHLGQADGRIGAARLRLGSGAIIGVTCHASLPLAQSAQAEGASYVAFGRFFDSHTKPEAPPADLGMLREARAALEIPICAIGGITPDNAPALLEAGADMLAVIHGVFGQADVTAAAERYARLF
ncbi:thiamine phosphate synthase [Sulfuriflexus sp.]|uniref:thiamine phosphate synthase n=1 Tax=Sulfuriflexus sp. TaxID=2015443 RepID=UPI0028CDB7D7|nr:thiamine phosphate synthase [Sulfuriflexus sp.]MDT8404139.1 thiamine phosphate synthase [Sulfuriflexus sp.]